MNTAGFYFLIFLVLLGALVSWLLAIGIFVGWLTLDSLGLLGS